ncbi:MAG: ABC transporter permease subunit [Pseudomonadota bacterium]|nr:ABC transporter permease subunit [Pseudomonadota bacterium]
MRGLLPLFRRELAGYFATPVAWVFIVVFLATTAAFTFYLGNFFVRDQADLRSFFTFHPWLYLFLIPAIGMRLWSEERKSGTIELLLTLPISVPAAVLGKFLAAWAFTAIALALTFPLWITVDWLGDPDHGVIVASYAGSLLMAGGYLAITACISALTQNQVIAFVVSTATCFLFTVSGSPLVLEFFSAWAPQPILDQIAGFSFITHFQSIIEGVIDLRDIVYFGSLIAVWLFANAVIIEHKKLAG